MGRWSQPTNENGQELLPGRLIFFIHMRFDDRM